VLSFAVYISSEIYSFGKIKNPPPKGVGEGARLNETRIKGLSNLKNTYIGTTQSGEPSEGTAQSGEPTKYNFKNFKHFLNPSITCFIPYCSILFIFVKRVKN